MRHGWSLSRRALLGGVGASIACGHRSSWAQPGSTLPVSMLARAQGDAVSVLANGYLEEFGVPGLSVAVARNGRIVYAQGFGFADPAPRDPVTPAHLFRIASVTKPFTATAAFVLIEQ